MAEAPRRGAPPAASVAEVYGFVGWVASAVCGVAWLLWAYVPDDVLERAGLGEVLPAKRWALVLPAWLCVLVLSVYLAYEGWCLLACEPPESRLAVTDRHAQRPVDRKDEPAGAVPAVADLPLPLVNRACFGADARPG